NLRPKRRTMLPTSRASTEHAQTARNSRTSSWIHSNKSICRILIVGTLAMLANESVARCCTGLRRDKIRPPLRSLSVRRLTESFKQRDPIRWRLGVCAAIAMALLALVPQFHLWASRGKDWQGTFVSFDFDEVVYASYLNALTSGRPRRNDPYTGRDDAPNQPQPESLYSIQFVPAYVLAMPARAVGL